MVNKGHIRYNMYCSMKTEFNENNDNGFKF